MRNDLRSNLFSSFLPGLGMVFLMWLVYYIEVTFSLNFNSYGINTRNVVGLRGVLFSPFIHGSLSHLWSNTIPMMVLMFFLFKFYSRQALILLISGGILTGVSTWLIAENGTHIGASGLIYLLVFFLMFKGFIKRNRQLVTISFIVVFFYGSLIWYVLPVKAGMSWEGHLSGAITGILLAFLIPTGGHIPDKKYDWEREDYNPNEDAFLRHFDEDGNFIELEEEE